MGKKPWTMAVFAAAVVLIVGACSPSASGSPAASSGAGPSATAGAAATGAPSAAPAAAVPAVPTGYAELDKALGTDKPFKGKTVNIQTQWVAGEGTNFAAALADF